MTNNQLTERLTDEELEDLICELEAAGFYRRQLIGLVELQERRKADSEAQATLRCLAVVLHGSEVDLGLLTVTAQSLVDRCKGVSNKNTVIATIRNPDPFGVGGDTIKVKWEEDAPR